MTCLVIARHGNTFTPDEAPRRVGRRTDLPLVRKGREQAARLGHYLMEQGLVPDEIFCSTLQRTIQTAEGAIKAMELALTPEQRRMFDEIDYGPDEDKPEAQVRARLGDEALRAWEDDNIVPEGWRGEPEAIIRNWQAFADERRNLWPRGTVLVVTSGGIARFAPYMTRDLQEFYRSYRPKLSPGALGLIAHENDQWCVKGWNVRA